MLAHSLLIESSSKLQVTRTGIKARTSSISGLWFPWPIYMFFEMRFDLGTLNSGERSLPFWLLVISLCSVLCTNIYVGLGSAVACAWCTDGLGFDPWVRQKYSYVEINHSLPTADSSTLVVSCCQKNAHWVLVNRLGLSLSRKNVVR